MNGAVQLPLDLAELSFTASGDSLVRRTVLPSGVRILSEQRARIARSATIGYWVAVGSRDEHPATYGSTHFLEHLLFKGTTTRTALDIAVSFDAVGGEHNAMTAKEYTCYYAKVQDRDLPMAVDVSPTCSPRRCSTARSSRPSAASSSKSSRWPTTTRRMSSASASSRRCFGEHPLGRPIGGSPATIKAVTRDAVWDHYRANYRPQDLVITVAGAVDHDELVAGVDTRSDAAGWDLVGRSAARSRVATRAADLIERGSPLTRRPASDRAGERAARRAGARGLRRPRRPTLTVLNSILGGGMSSRLFQEIREKRGLAYSVYSFSPSYSDAGLFGMYAGCTPGEGRAGHRADARRVPSPRHRRRHRRGDCSRARGQLSGASALALEDSDTRMSRLGRSEITLGEFVDLDESLRRLAAGHRRRRARARRRARVPPALDRRRRHGRRRRLRRTRQTSPRPL